MEDRFRALMEDAELSKYTDSVLALRKNSIRINLEPAAQGNGTVGESRIGGLPDLPPGIAWPEWIPPVVPRKPGLLARLFGRKDPEPPPQPEPSAHAFIAQLNLSQVMQLDKEKLLPESGMLYFFYDAQEQPWGYDPAHRGGWKAIYYNGDLSQLAPAEPPAKLDKSHIFKPCRLSFSNELMFPPYDSLLYEALGMSEDDQYKLGDVFEEVLPEEENEIHITRLLGYPDEIQGDMLGAVQLASTGTYAGDNISLSPEQKNEATKWRLLFQMSSEDAAGMNWVDGGRLFYFIREQDLTQRNFDNVWLSLECY